MMYQFTSKQVATLVVCLAVLGFLTFSAGVLAGLGLAMPTREEVALLKAGKPPAVATGAPPKLPATIPTVAALGTKLPPAVAATAAVQPAPAAPAPAASPVPESPAPAPLATPPAPQPANEPPAASPAPAAAPAPAEQPEFALQLGSFRDLNHAKQMQADLKDRGYNTSILTALDADQREWHVVRIDGFKTLASASQAAAQFIDKERIPAVVRRSKAL